MFVTKPRLFCGLEDDISLEPTKSKKMLNSPAQASTMICFLKYVVFLLIHRYNNVCKDGMGYSLIMHNVNIVCPYKSHNQMSVHMCRPTKKAFHLFGPPPNDNEANAKTRPPGHRLPPDGVANIVAFLENQPVAVLPCERIYKCFF